MRYETPGAIGILPRPLAYSAFWLSFIRMRRPEGTPLFTLSGSRVDKQRNMIVEAVLNSKAQWLLFIDDDHLVPVDGLERLMAHNKPFVTGVYLTKNEPFRTTQMGEVEGREGEGYASLTAEQIGSKALVPIDATGMGFTLIRREVFEALPKPWYSVAIQPNGNVKGEDVYFCEKARKAGIELLADVSLNIPHLTPRGVVLKGDQVTMQASE